jgi:uncharacterized protein (TIGR03118 family)
MSFSGTSPFWVSNQLSGTATLYNALGNPVTQTRIVTIPTSGGPPQGPTGQVFNSTASSFMIPVPGGTVKSTFLFDTLGGTLQGWNSGLAGGGASSEIVATVPGAVFTGLALASNGGANYLYAANSAGAGGIVVFDSNFNNVTGTTFAGKFVDPNPVPGFSPYNIQQLSDGNIYVTYASTTKGAPNPGGYVDEYDTAGDLIRRIATNGPINAPWGLALAPSGFGQFGGDILIGNLYNSVIDAYNPTTFALAGSITVNTGYSSPVGFWAIDFGNGVTGGANTLYFTAGVNNQLDGLFGSISTLPEPGSIVLLILGMGSLGLVQLSRPLRSEKGNS